MNATTLLNEARRLGINIHSGASPAMLIPLVEARINELNSLPRATSGNPSDHDPVSQTMDDVKQFLALLRTLPARVPYGPPSAQNINSTAQSVAPVDAPQPQPSSPVDPPSTTRRQAVDHPSPDVSDASTDASTTPPPPPRPLSPTEQARAAYMAQLLREATTPSPIDDFPLDRQQSLYQLLQDNPATVVVKMIAAPEPVGWNFHISDTSLRRFERRYRKKLEAAERAAAYAEARAVIEQTSSDEQAYTQAAQRLMKLRLYQTVADPAGSDTKLELLFKLLDRQRRTDLAERRVQIAEKQLQPD